MNIDDQKIELERQGLEIESKRIDVEKFAAQNERSLINKHFGALITALVTFAAVIVSASQIWVAKISHDHEMELAHIENTRQWNLDVAKYVAENQNLIFTEDVKQRERIRNVMVATFPPEITEALFVRLEQTVPNAERETWREGQKVTTELQKYKVSLQYNSETDEELAKQLAETLKKNGYHVSHVWVNKNQTDGDVRYFNSNDESAGQDVENIVEGFLKDKGYSIDISLLYPKQYEGKVKRGSLEIWLPMLTQK